MTALAEDAWLAIGGNEVVIEYIICHGKGKLSVRMFEMYRKMGHGGFKSYKKVAKLSVSIDLEDGL